MARASVTYVPGMWSVTYVSGRTHGTRASYGWRANLRAKVDGWQAMRRWTASDHAQILHFSSVRWFAGIARLYASVPGNIDQSQRAVLCTREDMRSAKRFVYVLKNGEIQPRYYTGVTSSVTARLLLHNEGLCRHTATGRPWRADVIVEFADEPRAVAFENYLKSGSGVAFAKRHLR